MESDFSETCRIHVEPFHPDWLELEADQSKAVRPEDCRDVELFCKDWAASGEAHHPGLSSMCSACCMQSIQG